MIRTLSGSSEGVGDSADLAVTQKGAGANMSVDIAAGSALIRGDEANYAGTYHVVNDATVNLAIATADGVNPRRDLVVAKVQDATYSGGVNAWSLAVVTGTPAGSPADPAVPNNAIVLARVAVAALAGSITNANITDLRPRAFAQGGHAIVNSARRPGITYGPGAAFTGLEIYEADTDRKLVYNSAGAWVTITPVSATVTTNQTRASASYGALGTDGPVCTLYTGTKALVTVHFQYYQSGLATVDGYMGIDVTGATTLAASDANAARVVDYGANSGDQENGARTWLITGLTAGQNTFTARYRCESANTGNFSNRDLTVVGIP